MSRKARNSERTVFQEARQAWTEQEAPLRVSEDLLQGYERIVLQGKEFYFPAPDEIEDFVFVGREQELMMAMAAFCPIDRLPWFPFLLTGPAGSGKTLLVRQVAHILGMSLYSMTGTRDMEPSSLTCTPVQLESGRIAYLVAALGAAMMKGQLFFLDEVGECPPSSLSTLLPVLDFRGSLEDKVAGLRIRAHRDFRACFAMNEEDEDGVTLPPKFQRRMSPVIALAHPAENEMKEILRKHAPWDEDGQWVEAFLGEFSAKEISPALAVDVVTYARRLEKMDERCRGGKEKASKRSYMKKAGAAILRNGKKQDRADSEGSEDEKDETVLSGLPDFEKPKKGQFH